LETDHGINISLKGLYYQLGKLGGRLKVPRPSQAKKDQQKVDEFKVTLADKLVALDLPKDKEIRL
jgi:transposase